MRLVIAIVLVAGVAAASPRHDARDVSAAIARGNVVQLRAMVFATAAADRDRVLDALVALGTLDGTLRARVPATAVGAAELARLIAGNKRAAALFSISACSLQSVTATEVVLRCEPRSCESACMAVRGEATVRVKNGKWAIEGLAIHDVGDTGACGCCM